MSRKGNTALEGVFETRSVFTLVPQKPPGIFPPISWNWNGTQGKKVVEINFFPCRSNTVRRWKKCTKNPIHLGVTSAACAPAWLVVADAISVISPPLNLFTLVLSNESLHTIAKVQRKHTWLFAYLNISIQDYVHFMNNCVHDCTCVHENVHPWISFLCTTLLSYTLDMNMGCTIVQLVSLSLYIISNCPMPIDAYCKHSTMSLIAVSEKHLKRSALA